LINVKEFLIGCGATVLLRTTSTSIKCTYHRVLDINSLAIDIRKQLGYFILKGTVSFAVFAVV
jgi:hypothetical protein